MSEWIVYSKDGLTERCKVKKLTYDGEFLGACSLTVNVSSPVPVAFELGDYLVYRGERFEINYDPTVVKQSAVETDGEGFVYENVIFNSLSDELTRCDFLDYVPSDNELHYSSLPTFTFFADSINKLAERIQVNLDRIYTGEKKWTVEVHPEYVNTLNVNIQVSNNTVWDALGFVNSKFGASFIIRNRTITIGTTGVAVGNVFSYGKGNGLYKIERNAESNQKIITRLRAYGSTRNMPSDYYLNVEGGDVPNNMAVKNLMLPSFPVTTHDPYIDSDNIEELGIREGTVFFDGSGDLEEIYPTMEGMTAEDLEKAGISVNATGALDEVFSAEQIEDNGVFEPAEGETSVTIPTFTITLKDVGFDINDYLTTSSATISMKDGMCGGREFEIVSCEKSGNNYVLTCNRHYDESLDLYFPYNSYQIESGDKFALLNIEMPDVYIKVASERLLVAAKAYLAKNDYVRYSYTLTVDNVFMARQHDEAIASGGTSIHDTIKEGDIMLFEDTDLGINGGVTIASLSINEDSDDSMIPQYEVTLKDEKTVGSLEKIQNQITSILAGGVGSGTELNTAQIQSLIEIYGSKIFLRKDKDDRSKGKISTDKAIEVGKFVTGASGAIIQVDATTGQTIAEVDKLYVRMKAYFETLEIINVNSIGGKQILSPAGAVKCIGVEELDDAYRCYFLGEQDGEIIENRWVEGMQAYSQMFNAKEGVSNKVSNTYYWRLVTGVSEDVVDYNNQKCHYIDLSKTDCDTGSDIPKAGDVINHRGCRTDVDYMNFIEFSSVGTNAPYITLFQGVNSYSLTDKEYVSFGYDQSTGRAYMNVYGDMFFGNRDESSYIKYNPTDGVSVKGKLSVGTTYNGSELGSLFDKQQEDLETFAASVTKEFESIRNEMDGAIDTWFGEETPTLDNYPASDWATNSDKDSHLGDLYYSNDGKAYRFQYTDTDGYYWAVIEDSEVAKALELAQKALDTADGKRRVFIVEPYPPYDLGDLWAAGEGQPLMRCINARESGSYYASDWALADDSHAYADAIKTELEQSIASTKSELDQAIADAESAANTYTDEGKAALQKSIDALEEAKANIDEVYTQAQTDGQISDAEGRALVAAQAEAEAAMKLYDALVKAYADGSITDEELAEIEGAKAALDAAKAYAEEKANEAFDNAMEKLAGYEYLKAALKEDTTVEGGLIQSSLIKLGYTGTSGYVVMAGSNGTLDSTLGDKSIAFWAGGDMLDRENGSTATNAADFLVRMDGSGYAAGGNLSWDVTGKITADPMSFFVGEDTVSALLKAFTITANSSNTPTLITPNAPFASLTSNGAVTLKSTLGVTGATTLSSTLAVTGDLTASSKVILGDIPMYKSQDGVVYIEGNLVVQGGITMYGTGSTDVPSIIDSLPTASTSSKGIAYFDSNYFSVSSDGKVSFIDATGGLDVTELQNYLTQNSYLNVTEGDGRYLKLTGGEIKGDLTISNNANFKVNLNATNTDNYNLISFTNNGTSVGYIGTINNTFRIKFDDYPFTYNGNIVWHEGNFTPSNYLLLSGGAMDSGAGIYNSNDANSGYGAIGFNSTENCFGSPTFPTTLRSSKDIRVYIAGTYTNLLHSGNYSSYALPLTGGSLTGTISVSLDNGIGLIITRTLSGVPYIRYRGTNGIHGEIGVGASGDPVIFSSAKGSTSWEKIWYAGNDGTGSGLDADLLDGSHLSDILASNVASATKLQTARIIWGQSFDGTKDISGKITTSHVSSTGGLDITANNEASGARIFLTAGALSPWSADSGLINLGNSGQRWNTVYAYTGDFSGRVYTPYVFLNKDNEGIYLTNDAISWHDSSNAFLTKLIGFTRGGIVSVPNTLSVKNLNLVGSDNYAATINIDTYLYIQPRIEGVGYSVNTAINPNGGNVGIGTSAPTDRLHVNGSLRLKNDTPHTLRLHDSNGYDVGFVAGTNGNECLAFIANNAVTSFMFVQGGTALKSWTSSTWTTQTPALQIKNNSVYINSLLGNSVTPTYKLYVNGVTGLGGHLYLTGAHATSSTATTTQIVFGDTSSQKCTISCNTNRLVINPTTTTTTGQVVLGVNGKDSYFNSSGNFGIGLTAPSYKLHVVGNTYLNGDVYVDDINTYDIIPRATESYSCGYSGSRWYQVYSYIGNFSGAVNMGSTLNVTGATTMSNATLTGDLRLKDSANYGRAIYFGDGSYCYLKEATDDVLTIYASKGIAMNTSSTSYNVSMNTNLLVSGGITMYNTSDQRKKKNIRTFNASQELMSLGGVYQFEYNDDEVEKNGIYKGTHVGLIYQNVKGTILDKMCYEREDGYGALNYLDSSFISLIAAVEIEHETRIQKLERENKLLREEVERLKAS